MVQVYYNQKDTEKFVAKVLKNGGTANVRKPYGERDPFTEIEWTHDANRQITQIIYGWPNRYKVLEEYEKDVISLLKKAGYKVKIKDYSSEWTGNYFEIMISW